MMSGSSTPRWRTRPYVDTDLPEVTRIAAEGDAKKVAGQVFNVGCGESITLLQLAAGFRDELDAEENILLVGEFLGVPSSEMKKKMQEMRKENQKAIRAILTKDQAKQLTALMKEFAAKTLKYCVQAKLPA